MEFLLLFLTASVVTPLILTFIFSRLLRVGDVWEWGVLFQVHFNKNYLIVNKKNVNSNYLMLKWTNLLVLNTGCFILSWLLIFLFNRALHLAVINSQQEVMQCLVEVMAGLPETFVNEFNFLRQVSSNYCFLTLLLQYSSIVVKKKNFIT